MKVFVVVKYFDHTGADSEREIINLYLNKEKADNMVYQLKLKNNRLNCYKYICEEFELTE